MLHRLVIVTLLLCGFNITVEAANPIYIVNGEQRESIYDIAQEQIASLTELLVNEALIEKYGVEASRGVILVELKYDTPATLKNGESLQRYLTRKVKWDGSEGVGSISLRYRITAEGEFELLEILDVTTSLLRRRVMSVLKNMPTWIAATKEGEAVAWIGITSITLPVGGVVPTERYLISR